MRASRHYGLECNGLSVATDQLKKLQLPLILFWQFSHFVVLEGFDDRNFHLNDPSTGRRSISVEEFNKGYSGIALRFKRGEEFRTGGERPGLFSQLGDLLAGSWNALTGVIACGLMLTLLALIVPATLGIFVDDVLGNHGPWGGLVAALLGGGVLGIHPVPAQAPVPEAARGPDFGDRLQPEPDAAPAIADGVFCPQAGRRPDRPGLVHRPDREESD